MQRSGVVQPAVVVTVVALVLAGEGLLPGRTLVPVAPDDYGAWHTGREDEILHGHPWPNWSMAHLVEERLPALVTARRALSAGHAPTWDASVGLGVPVHEPGRRALSYPPLRLALAAGLPGLALLAVVHLVAAGLGMLLYLSALGRSRAAMLVGAIAFVGSSWLTAWLQDVSTAGSAVWLPWLLFGLERGARRGGGAGYPVAAAALGLSVLAGALPVATLLVAVALLLEIVRLARAPRTAASWTAAGRALAAVVLGVALGAPQLLPARDGLSDEVLMTLPDAASWSEEALPRTLLAQLVVPDLYADASLRGPHPLALRDLDDALDPEPISRARTAMGVGVLGLLLACASILFGRAWQTRTHALLAVGLTFAVGSPGVLAALGEALPPLRLGAPATLLLPVTFGLAALAAGGVDLLLRRRLRVTVTCWGLAVVLAGLVVFAFTLVPSVEEPDDVRRWAGSIAAVLDRPGVGATDIEALVTPDGFSDAAGAAVRSALVALATALAAILVFRPQSEPTERGWTSRIHRQPMLLPALVACELVLVAWPLLRAAPTSFVTEGSMWPEDLEPPPWMASLGSLAATRGEDAAGRGGIFGDGVTSGDGGSESREEAGAGSEAGESEASPSEEDDSEARAGEADGGSGPTGDQAGAGGQGAAGGEGAETDPSSGDGVPRGPGEPAAVRNGPAEAPGVRPPPRVARLGDDPRHLPGNLPGLFGLHALHGRSTALSRRVGELLGACAPGLVVSRDRIGGLPGLPALTAPVIDLLGVEAIMATRRLDELPQLTPLEPAGTVRVYANTDALPRAFVASRLEVLANRARRLARLAEPGFDPRTVVLEADPFVSGPSPSTGANEPSGRDGTAGAGGPSDQDIPSGRDAASETEPSGAGAPPIRRDVEIADWRPGAWALDVGPGPAALLVVTDAWREGWEATIDGRPAPVLRADHALLGVPVPEGPATAVSLRYLPPSRRLGIWTALAALVVLVLWGWRDRPRPPEAPEPEDEGESWPRLPGPRHRPHVEIRS